VTSVGAGERRRDLVRALLDEDQVDGLLVTSPPNIAYLSGFDGSNGALYVSASNGADDVIATDGRYTIQVSAQAPDLPAIIDRATVAALVRGLSGHGIVGLQVEDAMSIQLLKIVSEVIRTVIPGSGVVESLRAVKDAGELETIERACGITAAAFEQLFDEVREGWSEVQAARRLEQIFGEMGADDRAFDTIVGTGPNSAIPHHQPTMRPLSRGDLVVVDAGARVGGYHADMTRTVVVGKPAQDWQQEIHGCVRAAQAAALSRVRDGAAQLEIDAAARDHIAAAGFGDFYPHGLGHGVGLEIHEAPMIGPRSAGIIVSGTAITLEPGIYLPERGGVRIEDTVVVESGGGRVLTVADRGLMVVG
jgi:Xaa-Pro aminopeptidase